MSSETRRAAYVMNPAEDTLMFTDELAVGMWVMLENPKTRCSDLAPEDEQIRANRFARIIKLRDADEHRVKILILEWVDGFQRRLSIHKNATWIVKQESAPTPEAELDLISEKEGRPVAPGVQAPEERD